jgi:hypothetical protein
MKHPRPKVIETVASEDSPNGAITTVAFDMREFEEFAKAHPNTSFQVEQDDGRLFPFPISTASYWAAWKDNI